MRNRPRLSLLLHALGLLLCVLALAGALAGVAAATGFSGRVTDAVTGKPVPHAIVSAYQAADGGYYTYWVADDQGAYTVYLYQGAWKLRFMAPFHVTEYWDDKADLASADVLTADDAVPQVTGLDVALAPSPQAHFTGKVVDGSTGDPLVGVMVQACTPGVFNGAQYVYTGDDGTYDLPVEPGTWGLCYSKHGYETLYHRNARTPEESSVVTVADGDVLTRFDEALPRWPVMVTGMAMDVDGLWHAGIALQLLDPATGAVLRQAYTDVDGSCSIDVGDMLGQPIKARLRDPSGEYADAYYGYNVHPEPTFAEAATFTPEVGGSYAVFMWMYARQRGEIKGRVLDEDGSPVQGVQVNIRPMTPFGSGAPSQYSAADGSFEFSGLYVAGNSRFYLTFEPGLDHPEYTWQITHQRATDRHPDGILVGPGQTVTVDSSLWHVPAIGGDVTGSANQPLEGIHVDLYDAQDALLTSTTTVGGAFHFSKLELGTYHVKFRDDAGLYAGTTEIATPSAGEKMWFLDVSLVPLHSIHGRVTAERLPGQDVSGATVTLYGPTGTVLQRQAASDSGNFLFEPLPAGTYRVGVEPLLAFLSAYFPGEPWLDAATPVTLDGSTAQAMVSVTVPARCASPLVSVARNDGSPDDSRPLFGRATALAGDGDTVLAGEGWSGSARVFTHGTGGWELQQLLTPGATAVDDHSYGQSVAVSGDTAVVGAFYDDGSGRDPGKVFVYRRTGDAWDLEQVIAPTGADHRSFGKSVALSDGTLLVGGPYAAVDGHAEAGAAFVYTLSDGTWRERATLSCRGATADDHFGSAVALQDGTAVIGAPLRDTDVRVNAGEAFVFTGSGGDWSQREVFSPSGDDAPAFGDDVALDSGTAAVGSPSADGTGVVCVYTGSGASWTRQARLTTADARQGWRVGQSIALKGDELLVWGDRSTDSPDGRAPGAAYVFRRNGAGWVQDAVLRVRAAADAHWRLGPAVALAGGDELVAAPDQPDQSGTGAYGIVYAFHPYVTEPGQTQLQPAAGGVLANDHAASGKALTATLMRPPYSGSVQLSADGTFSYTPADGWAGTDSFTYAASDGTWTSQPATVTVTTRDKNAPMITADDIPSGWTAQPVTVELAAKDDTEVAALDYRQQASGSDWRSYAKPITVSAEGGSSFAYRARDIFGNARRGGFTVRVDTRSPAPRFARPCSAQRRAMLSIGYRVNDPRPGSPTAAVTITALRRGRTVLTLHTRCRVDRPATFRTRCSLPRGRYTLSITARDAAGNRSRRPATTTLRVY